MDQSYIPSRLGVFRISSEDKIYRKHLTKLGKEYLFVLAAQYPESLSVALAIIYFPAGPPRGTCTASIHVRDEFSSINGNVTASGGSCGGVFRKLADVTAKETPGFSIEVSRVGKSRPQVFGNAASFIAAQHPTGSDDEDDEDEMDDLAGEKVKFGLHFRRIMWGDPVYSTWEETGSAAVEYIASGKLVGDQTNGQKVITIHQFTHKPSKAKFSFELVKNSGGEYVLFREHRLPVLAMTALHCLLAHRYWANALNDDPQKSEEISKARYENPFGA